MTIKIVLEGFDGGGKSGLATDLSRCLNIKHHKNGPAPKSIDEAMQFCADQHVTLHSEGGVMDRLTCVSNLCYNDTYMSPVHMTWMAHFAQATIAGTHFIMCEPASGFQPGKEDYDSEEYMTWLEENKDRILGKYDMFHQHILPTIKPRGVYQWDFENDDFDQLVYAILRNEYAYKT